MKKLSFLSPILVSILTVTTLYAANAYRLEWSQIWIPLLMGLIVSLLFMFIFWLNPFTSKQMPFIASIFTLAALLFYIPHPAIAGVLMAGAVVIMWRIKHLQKATIFISVIALFGIVVSSGQALFINHGEVKAQQSGISMSEKIQPNIYFIVPDRMPNIVGIREFNINPDNFIAEMSGMGFYINPSQMSQDEYTPYSQVKPESTRTMRYFASVLNGGADIPLTIKYQECRKLIQQPELFNTLHEKGYYIVNIASWFTETKSLPVDFTMKYQDIGFMERVFDSELSVAYWQRTIFNGINFRFLQSDDSMGQVERGRTVWQAEELKAWSSPDVPGQKFVICHILMPHEPYVFDTNGGPVIDYLSDTDKYRGQLEYALKYLADIAKSIIENDPGAIIIMQSDEGCAFQKPVELNYSLTQNQWNGVLTAWRIPGKDGYQSLKHTEIAGYLISH
jgi:hypothetical protein